MQARGIRMDSMIRNTLVEILMSNWWATGRPPALLAQAEAVNAQGRTVPVGMPSASGRDR